MYCDQNNDENTSETEASEDDLKGVIDRHVKKINSSQWYMTQESKLQSLSKNSIGYLMTK